MIDFKSENMSSESFYPDSNYYLDQEIILRRLYWQKIKYLFQLNLNGQIAIGLLQKELMEDLQ